MRHTRLAQYPIDQSRLAGFGDKLKSPIVLQINCVQNAGPNGFGHILAFDNLQTECMGDTSRTDEPFDPMPE